VLSAIAEVTPEAVATLVLPMSRSGPFGTGEVASAVDAEDACVFIRAMVAKSAGEVAAESVRIHTAGSVNAENCADLLGDPTWTALGRWGQPRGPILPDIIRAAAA